MDQELSQRLEALAEQVSALKQENRRLWAKVGSPSEKEDAAPAGGRERSPVSRRGLLAAAAGTAAGLVVGRAAPASAANGDPVLLGGLNKATTNTIVEMSGGSAAAMFCEATATSGIVSGAYGRSNSTTGRGLSGVALAQTGVNAGVYGQSNSTSGRGVIGTAIQSTGITYGVYGQSNSSSGRGVYGVALGSSGFTYGVFGESRSTSGRGVFGNALASSGTTFGVLGAASSPSGYGVYASGRFKSTGRTFLGTPSTPPADTDLGNSMISFHLDQAANKLRVRVKYSNGTLKTGTVNLS